MRHDWVVHVLEEEGGCAEGVEADSIRSDIPNAVSSIHACFHFGDALRWDWEGKGRRGYVEEHIQLY